MGSGLHDSVERLWIGDELRKLPRRQREAVTLRYLADLPEQDVAAAMGVSVGTVKVHLHRGLEALGRSTGSAKGEEVSDVVA